MIVRDSRSPKGRYEDSCKPDSTVSRLLSINTGHGVMEEGQTWKTLDARAKAYRLGQRPTGATQRCAFCDTPFTPVRSWALYCRLQCQKSARWRRQKGTTNG